MVPGVVAEGHVLSWGKPPAWAMVCSGEEKPGSHQGHSGTWRDIPSCTISPSPGKQNQGVASEGPAWPLPTGGLRPSRLSWRQRSRAGTAGRGQDPQPGWARAQTRLKLQDVRNPPGICQHTPRANSQRRRRSGELRGESLVSRTRSPRHPPHGQRLINPY